MSDAGAGEKLKVFISYSRRDSAAFADELVAGLEFGGFAPFLDRHDVAAGEDWEARLEGLIVQSDTVVFVVSPEAVKSERCTWEVDRTIQLSKRLLPVIFKPVPEHHIPEKLRRLQFVRFDGGAGFARPLSQLAEALRADLGWIREHTRLGELARRWDTRGRPESLLLRGDDVETAKLWVAARKPAAPEITDAQRAFIKASEEAETTRLGKERAQLEATTQQQRRIAWLLGGLAVLVGASILGLIAWINQEYIKEQWRWYSIARPYMLAQVRPYVLTDAAERMLKPKDRFRECKADHGTDYCPEMTVIGAGSSFMMGVPERETDQMAKPQYMVTFAKPFSVSTYHVTFDEWDTCVAYGDCKSRPNDLGWGRGQRPVIYVSWHDARQYVAWLSKMTGKPYRLLTEAEYEYAARAGRAPPYDWGDEAELNGLVVANCNGCNRNFNNHTTPVGSFTPNAFGLFDMVGNVWGWLQDCFHDAYEINTPQGKLSAPTDGSAWISGDCSTHVIRGGSWNTIRKALFFRNGANSDRRDADLGFRVGRTLRTP